MRHYINAGDAKAWKLCKRRVWFDHYPPLDLIPVEDAFERLIQQAGEAHEQKVLAHLSQVGKVIEATSSSHTQSLIAQRVPVIYQPIAKDKVRGVVGRPDFLVLREAGNYQVVDAKLAASLKSRPDLRIQLSLYRNLFNSSLPAIAYLGSGKTEEVGQEADQLSEAFLKDMRALLAESLPPDAYFAYSKCQACPYREFCIPDFERVDHLSLLYGLDARSIVGLNAQGVMTITDLANKDPGELKDIPYLSGEAKKQRAVRQAQSICSGQWQLVEEIRLPEGTWIHFDVETNPLSELGNEVYLWGLLPPPYDSNAFDFVWSDGGREMDYQAWLIFLEKVDHYRRRYPDIILAHFANFEVAQIKSYAVRYGMELDERVCWLLGENSPLFDLLEVVRRSLILPLKSYGLKPICKSPHLVNFQWELEESGSQWSVVRYIDYLHESSEQKRLSIKQEILSYNRDDVKATHALEAWLRALSQ